MSIYEDVNNIKLLQNLLKPADEQSSDSEDEHLPGTGLYKFGPGDIKPTKPSTINKANTEASTSTSLSTGSVVKPPAVPPKSIEEWQDLHEQEDLDTLESRRRPDFNITYKQDVRTEDVFLQMGCKTGATSSCDEMVLTIEMPDETVGIERMSLAVTADSVDLQSPVYRLKMPLPQRINPDAGSAKYDAHARRLTMRLKMVREFDYVNF